MNDGTMEISWNGKRNYILGWYYDVLGLLSSKKNCPKKIVKYYFSDEPRFLNDWDNSSSLQLIELRKKCPEVKLNIR